VTDSAVNLAPRAFRDDINGLRAWAVLAVVLYHFGVVGFRGGFVGVDVFFVISGFLMTGIVGRGLAQGNFSLWQFYWDRAKRIVPALLVLAAVLLLVGWFWLMPHDYKGLARHAGWSVLFKSNIGYLQEAGYFDGAAREKWLLHTWSLSVEWQFYLLYPLLVAGLWKLIPKRGALLAAHGALALASWVACIVMTRQDSAQAFFLLPSRAWELLLGGLVYLLFNGVALSAWQRRLLESVGLALIVFAVLTFEASTAWPGMLALVPVLGAGLLLAANRQGSLWTGHALAQWLGSRSYSVYLWHWPLVVGLVYLGHFSAPAWLAAGLLLTLVLGELSYRWVELPTRQTLQRMPRPQAVTALLLALVSVFSLTQWLRRDGLPSRMPAEVAAIEAEQYNRNPRLSECSSIGAPCVYGGDQIKAIVVGDSHAGALVTAVEAALPDQRDGVYFHAAPGCLFVPGGQYPYARDHGRKCQAVIDSVHAKLKTEMPGTPLILINRTSAYLFGYNEDSASRQDRKPQVFFGWQADSPTPAYLADFSRRYVQEACSLAQHRRVYLMRPIPELLVKVPTVLGRDLILGRYSHVAISRADYQARNAFVWAAQDQAHAQCGVEILDPLPYLCDEQFCYGSRDGKPLYSDDNHLSEYGNRVLVPMFAKVFGAEGRASSDR
jgi:peptidoglycan/LPS O-acetylase OafA/YrhL